MGQHRSADGRRGVSRGLIFALLSILLVAAVVVTWNHLGDSLDRQADDAAGDCVEGNAEVPVIADPDIAEALKTIAENYNKTAPVVRDHCIDVAVRPGDAKVTLDGLTSTWDPASMGTFPAAWVPQSSIWSAELVTARPTALEGEPSSLVTSPVVLAMSPELATAFDGQLQWTQVPTLQARNDSLSSVGLNGIGSLRMAMPRGSGSDATSLSAQAVASAITRTTGPLSAADAASDQVTTTVTELIDGAPQSPDGTPTGAATSIADAPSLQAASIRVVPITEQRLYQLTKDDATATLAEVVPGGPTPLADYPVIRLAGDQVSDVANAAVAEFFSFAMKAEQLKELTQLGFRGDAPLPTATATVTFPNTRDPMPVPETAATISINRLVFGADSAPRPAGS